MTPRLPTVTARQLVRVAKHLGFYFDRQTGSHAVYYREADRARVVIPMHRHTMLKPRTLLGILHDLGVTVDELREYLRDH